MGRTHPDNHHILQSHTQFSPEKCFETSMVMHSPVPYFGPVHIAYRLIATCLEVAAFKCCGMCVINIYSDATTNNII